MTELRPNTPAYWIFIPALAFSGFFVASWLAFLNHHSPQKSGDYWAGASCMIVFLTALAGPFCRALGRHRAASIIAAITLALYWAIGASFFCGSTARSVVGLLYFWPLTLLALVIIIPATISSSRRLNPGWTFASSGIGAFCGVIVMLTMLSAKEADRNFPRPLDPIILAPDMVTVAKCAQIFASNQPTLGYPQSLAQLGSKGNACLPPALLTPPDKGFVIAYQPGAKDASGRIADYTAIARETKPVGPDVTSIFTNQSGLIRYRYDGPHGKGGVYIYFPALYPFTELLRCLRNAANGPTRFITEHSDELVADPEEMVSRCLGPDLHPSNRAFTRLGYEFHYVIRTGNAGSLIGFTIESRPELTASPVSAAITRSPRSMIRRRATPSMCTQPPKIAQPLLTIRWPKHRKSASSVSAQPPSRIVQSNNTCARDPMASFALRQFPIIHRCSPSLGCHPSHAPEYLGD
jgi:hypothetical protein